MTNISEEVNTNREHHCDVTDSSTSTKSNDATLVSDGENTVPASGKQTKGRRHSDYAVYQNKLRYKPSCDIPSGTKSVLAKSKQVFEERIRNHEVDKLINPFSEFWGQNRHQYHGVLQNAKAVWKDADKRTKLNKSDQKYGKPVEGTMTEKRGHKARDFIANNMIELCETIVTCGQQQPDGTWAVKFGKLFKAYERINDKVVGLLVRARRHGLVDFPGEMLYQRQDDDVLITLFKVPKFEDINLKYIKFDYEKAQEALERGAEPSIQ